ncbi:hypothetical protein [Holospora curviuscula]|nr:hypothetical protein [Holospora curviuscula]
MDKKILIILTLSALHSDALYSKGAGGMTKSIIIAPSPVPTNKEKEAEQEAKAKAEQEAKEKAEQEAKEKAEQEAKEQEAKEQEAKTKAEQEAKEKTEKEIKGKAEQEAKEKELQKVIAENMTITEDLKNLKEGTILPKEVEKEINESDSIESFYSPNQLDNIVKKILINAEDKTSILSKLSSTLNIDLDNLSSKHSTRLATIIKQKEKILKGLQEEAEKAGSNNNNNRITMNLINSLLKKVENAKKYLNDEDITRFKAEATNIGNAKTETILDNSVIDMIKRIEQTATEGQNLQTAQERVQANDILEALEMDLKKRKTDLIQKDEHNVQTRSKIAKQEKILNALRQAQEELKEKLDNKKKTLHKKGRRDKSRSNIFP